MTGSEARNKSLSHAVHASVTIAQSTSGMHASFWSQIDFYCTCYCSFELISHYAFKVFDEDEDKATMRLSHPFIAAAVDDGLIRRERLINLKILQILVRLSWIRALGVRSAACILVAE